MFFKSIVVKGSSFFKVYSISNFSRISKMKNQIWSFVEQCYKIILIKVCIYVESRLGTLNIYT